jgi:hypothetical protein
MKRIILSGLLCLGMVLTGIAKDREPARDVNSGVIQSVVINANVTVVLTNFGDNEIRITGDDFLKQQVHLRRNGNKLVISANKRSSLLGKVVIYVPAAYVSRIFINSDAHVHSSGILQNPKLDVFINGACRIMIDNIGQLNFMGNRFFDCTYEGGNIWIGEERGVF